MRFGLRFGKQTKCWFLHLNAIQALYHIGQHGAQSIVLHFSVDLRSCYKHCKHCRPYIEKVLSSRMQCHYQIDRVPYKCAVTNYIRCVNAFIKTYRSGGIFQCNTICISLHFIAFHCISLLWQATSQPDISLQAGMLCNAL